MTNKYLTKIAAFYKLEPNLYYNSDVKKIQATDQYFREPVKQKMEKDVRRATVTGGVLGTLPGVGLTLSKNRFAHHGPKAMVGGMAVGAIAGKALGLHRIKSEGYAKNTVLPILQGEAKKSQAKHKDTISRIESSLVNKG